MHDVMPAARCGCVRMFSSLNSEKGSLSHPASPLQWLVAMETDAQGSRIIALKLCFPPPKRSREAGKWIHYEPSLCLRTIASEAWKCARHRASHDCAISGNSKAEKFGLCESGYANEDGQVPCLGRGQ